MQTIFKWASLPLTQLSSSTARGQFEQIVIDSHLTERPPFQLIAQSQLVHVQLSSFSTLCAPTEDLLIDCQHRQIHISSLISAMPTAGISQQQYGSNFIAQMDSKDRFNAIYSRCLTLNDRTPSVLLKFMVRNFYALAKLWNRRR